MISLNEPGLGKFIQISVAETHNQKNHVLVVSNV